MSKYPHKEGQLDICLHGGSPIFEAELLLVLVLLLVLLLPPDQVQNGSRHE
jgi:hypothetical protein